MDLRPKKFQLSIREERRGIVTLDQAREIFERTALASNADCVLVEGATCEFAGCFAFFYQSKKFVETGDFAEMLVGQGPVLISREDGKVFETGSAFSVHHYVAAFEACGDPFGEPTAKVKICGWNPGFDKVRAIQLVKAISEMGLSQAKSVIDHALSNSDSLFTARTVEDAEQAVVGLKENGFNSVQLWSNQR
jgi:ribosomal protein L7/L12